MRHKGVRGRLSIGQYIRRQFGRCVRLHASVTGDNSLLRVRGAWWDLGLS